MDNLRDYLSKTSAVKDQSPRTRHLIFELEHVNDEIKKTKVFMEESTDPFELRLASRTYRSLLRLFGNINDEINENNLRVKR